MGAAPPERAGEFQASLLDALQLASTARTSKTNTEREKVFQQWNAFCRQLGTQPDLREIPLGEARLAYLLVFGVQYRRRGRTGRPVKAGSVASALLAVGEGITHLGQPDPRKQAQGGDRLHPLRDRDDAQPLDEAHGGFDPRGSEPCGFPFKRSASSRRLYRQWIHDRVHSELLMHVISALGFVQWK